MDIIKFRVKMIERSSKVALKWIVHLADIIVSVKCFFKFRIKLFCRLTYFLGGNFSTKRNKRFCVKNVISMTRMVRWKEHASVVVFKKRRRVERTKIFLHENGKIGESL